MTVAKSETPKSESHRSASGASFRKGHTKLALLVIAFTIFVTINAFSSYLDVGGSSRARKGTKTLTKGKIESDAALEGSQPSRSKTLLESKPALATFTQPKLPYNEIDIDAVRQKLSADDAALGLIPATQGQAADDTTIRSTQESKTSSAETLKGTIGGKTSVSSTAAVAESGKKLTFLQAIQDCVTLQCLKDAHLVPRKQGQFNFPHALMVGWQKTATTSLYYYLDEHPQVLTSLQKEPEFFTRTCDQDPIDGCSLDQQRVYIRKLRRKEFVEVYGKKMTFEASTHYGMNGAALAPKLHKVFPWVKIVISMREPISRAMSLLIHMADPKSGHRLGCMAEPNADLYTCLMTDSQLVGRKKSAKNTPRFLKMAGKNYSAPVKSWLEAYGKDQVFLVQYEALTSEEQGDAILADFKQFLDLDPELPEEELGMHNTRKMRIRPEGWPMTKQQYESLVDYVRPDAEAVASLVEQYGFDTAADWMSRWQAVWQENLDTCDDEGNCKIRPS